VVGLHERQFGRLRRRRIVVPKALVDAGQQEVLSFCAVYPQM
jgi:hypothetical protein